MCFTQFFPVLASGPLIRHLLAGQVEGLAVHLLRTACLIEAFGDREANGLGGRCEGGVKLRKS